MVCHQRQPEELLANYAQTSIAERLQRLERNVK